MSQFNEQELNELISRYSSIDEIKLMADNICSCEAMKDFNGHFWIEKDGEVYDNYNWMEELSDFKHAFGIKKRKPLKYERCDDETTNKIVFGIWSSHFKKSGKTEDEIKEFISLTFKRPKRLCCFLNAIARQSEIGGKIVFGSVYMKSDDNTKKHYIIGCPNATTLYDFKKQYNPFESLFC